MHSTTTNGYGHLLLVKHPETKELRIKAAGQAAEGLTLFSIPPSTAGSTGINVTVHGEHIATFHHLAVDSSHIAYAYHPDSGSYHDVRLGPCSITMDK